jgi:hypothetical protein
MNKASWYFFLFTLGGYLPLFLTGCQTARLEEFDAAYTAGEYERSASIALGSQDTEDPEKSKAEGKLLFQLLAAGSLRAAGDPAQSNTLLDSSETLIIRRDNESAGQNATQFLGSVLVNDSALPYDPATYDKIMVNTYKALNYLATGDIENARIEVNRAYERQGRAVDEFAAKIKKQQEALESKQSETGVDFARTNDNPQLTQLVKENYSNIDAWAAYPDFVNPFSTYVHGLVKLFAGTDAATLSDAHEFFKRTYGMAPSNNHVATDLLMMEDLLNGRLSRASIPPTVWLVFENGLCPKKEQIRIDIPLFLVTSDITYTGIALPILRERHLAYENLCIVAEGRSVNTESVGSMDSVVAAEFKKNMPWLVSRAILRTVLKTGAQYALQQGDDDGKDLVGHIFGIYQLATNTADTRIWSTLPKDFQVARLPIPEDRTLAIFDNNQNLLGNVTIPEGRLALVSISIPQAGAPPAVTVRAYN